MAELRTHSELTELGETAIVSALLSLPSAYTVLPHLSLPYQTWHADPDDIDVVVIGPNGLFVLEYKHWHGSIAVAEHGPWRHQFAAGGEERRNPLTALAEKRRCLADFLATRQLGAHPVHGALVFPDRSRLEGHENGDRELAGVPLLPLGQVVGWLTGAGKFGSLAPDAQLAIAEQLRPASPRRMVNQYQLSTRLSRSAAKSTYLGYDTVKERPVVLQELAYDPYQQPAQLERVRNELLREAKLTMQLRHPNIVGVEHVIPRDDCYYIVTEWIEEGQSLAQLIAGRELPLPVGEAVAIAKAIATGLSYAHAQGIVHRDVRPENVLVAPDHVVKIANFGLAKKADMATRSTFDLRQMAQENPYVAPEFRLGATGPHQVDQRADIFSLGAILYQLLTGRVPHHLDEKYFEPPSAANPAVPSSLDGAVEKALRFDPAQRFSTMRAFIARLDQGPEAGPGAAERYAERRLVKRTRNSLVFQAFDTHLQRHVALKKVLLDPRLADGERQSQLTQVLREAQLASSLVHPHIVSVFDHFVEDDDGYIVMEWLEGANLREQLDAQAPPSFAQLRQLAQQVCDALQYAHSQGVVHRDIKPENILFHEGQATVLDFGTAHVADRGDAGRAAGTARYMAPEVLLGEPADVRSDIFSLGVLFYELLTGQYPYDGNVIMARFSGPLVHPPASASSLSLDCPPYLDAVLARALEVDPEARYATVAEFLRAFLDTDDRRGSRYEHAPRGGWGWPVLAGLSLMIFLGAAIAGTYYSRSLRTRVVAPTPATAPTTMAELPSPEPSPSLAPSVAPSVAPSPAAFSATWASRAVTIDAVTVQVAEIRRHDGRTWVSLNVRNGSPEAVSFLNRSDRPDLFHFVDDAGRDYTSSLDLISVDPQLLLIEPGTRVSGGFRLKEAVDESASSLELVLKEYAGKGRKFRLRSMKLVDN